METKKIKLQDLQLNKGQIKDVPKNPRFIRDKRFQELKKSLQEDPEFLQARPLVAYDNGGGKLVVIGGNMRMRALLELGVKEAPVVVFPHETPAKKIRAFVEKDNQTYGETDWDLVANEWDVKELKDWGIITPVDWDIPQNTPQSKEQPAAPSAAAVSQLLNGGGQAPTESGFKPNLNPTDSAEQTTQKDIEQAGVKIVKEITPNEKKTMQVTCPHCGKIFEIYI